MMSAEEFFKDSEDEETSDDTSKEKVDEGGFVDGVKAIGRVAMENPAAAAAIGGAALGAGALAGSALSENDEDEEDKELQESLEAYRKQNARLFRS